jgi:hypothetical protein
MGTHLPVVGASRNHLRMAVFAGAILITLLLMGGFWSLFSASEPRPAVDPASSREAASVSGRHEDLDATHDQRVDASLLSLVTEEEETSDSPSTGTPGDELPPWKEFRLKEIEDRWTKLLEEVELGQQDPFNSVSFVVQICGRPIYDELGLGRPVPKGVHVRQQHVHGTHYMSTGDTDYLIPEGTFRAVDTFMSRWAEIDESHERAMREAGRAREVPPSRPFFPVDEQFLADLEVMKDQALEALMRRAEEY